DNGPQFPALMFASSMVGAVFVPINSMFAKDELAYILKQSDSRFLFVEQRSKTRHHGQAVSDLLHVSTFLKESQYQSVVCLVVVCVCLEADVAQGLSESFVLWEDFISQAEKLPHDAFNKRFAASSYPDEVMMILYTSGSTGNPKGVMLTEDMLLRSAYSTCYSRAIEDGRVTYAPLPFYHCFAIVESILAMTFVGGSFIEAMGASPLQSLQLMEKYQANDFLC